MPLPCLRPDSPRDLEPSDEMLFLLAIAKSPPGFDWTKIKPEDRTAWARRVLEWEADARGHAHREKIAEGRR